MHGAKPTLCIFFVRLAAHVSDVSISWFQKIIKCVKYHECQIKTDNSKINKK